MKSPKPEKKGKAKTTWDPFVFGGPGATGEEARSLDRSAMSPKGKKNKEKADGSDENSDEVITDQFVPDLSVINQSASK